MPIVYTPPNFNVSANVWLPPAIPSSSGPTFTAVACQFYTYSRTPQLLLHPATGRWLPAIIIRIPFTFPALLPPDTIFTSTVATNQGNFYYKVQYALHLHVGFPNQYFSLFCLQCNQNGTIPRTPLPT